MTAVLELLEDGAAPQARDARARRTLASLRLAMGYQEATQDAEGPVRVTIGWMEPTTWRRVGGRGDGAMFEREASS